MARKKPVGGSLGRYSWLNFCEPVSLFTIKGSINNKRRSDFWDMFVPPKIESTDNDAIHIVSSNERIENIAYRYYGSPLLWWVIAERNGIDLPLAELRQGMRLIIPSKSVIDTILQPNS